MNKIINGINILCNNNDAKALITPRKKEVISLLELYIKEIETFNDAYGLVKIKNTNELIIRHILDSLAPLGIIYRLIKNNCPLSASGFSPCIADAGSGAGLPGIPLAIALPDCKFTLIERMKKRAGFLLNTTAVLNLPNVIIEEKELKQTGKDQFDLITFRAFSPLEPKILKTLFKACKKTGIIAAYKGQREKIESEIAAVSALCCRKEIIQYSTPFLDEQRHLVVLYE